MYLAGLHLHGPALDAVVSTYRANKLPSPIHDNASRTPPLDAAKQLEKGFKNSDPSPIPQKAVSPTVIHAITSATDTLLDRAIGQLIVGTFFIAMSPCKYSSVSGECRTKLLELRNIHFYKNNSELATDSTFLHLADCASITFFFQKNEKCDENITMMHRTQDPMLCPIRSWAAVCSRIRDYPDPCYPFYSNQHIHPPG
jgi:hypothetical protein